MRAQSGAAANRPLRRDHPLLTMWVIYAHPSDHPQHYVLRRRHVLGGRIEVDTAHTLLANDLAGARALLPPGLFRLPRLPDDDPLIVEMWV
jgi:hypothetical protein